MTVQKEKKERDLRGMMKEVQMTNQRWDGSVVRQSEESELSHGVKLEVLEN